MKRSTQWYKGVVWYHPGLCVRKFPFKCRNNRSGRVQELLLYTDQETSVFCTASLSTHHISNYMSKSQGENYSTKQIVNGELAIM